MAAFTLEESRLSLGELARRVGLPKPTVYRLAASLVATGFMYQAADGSYGLGFRLLELGAVVRQNLDIVRICSAAMERLAKATEETVLLAQADWPAREVIILHRLDSAHPLSVASPIGRRSKLTAGCLTKALLMGLAPADANEVFRGLELQPATPKTHDKDVLLRELEERRRFGYAVEEDEYLEGVSGVAAPVIVEGGRPLAALGVVGPSTRMKGKLDQIGALVRDVALDLRGPESSDERRIGGGA